MSNNPLFMDLYREVEQKANIAYGYYDDGKAISNLIKEKAFADLRVPLKACREIRNILSHYPGELMEISPSLIETLQICVSRLDSGKTIGDVMTPFKSLITASLDDLVLPKLRDLKIRSLSNLPILMGKNPIGIYSGLCFSSLLADKESIDLKSLRFKDFGNYVLINKQNPTKAALISSSVRVWDARKLLKERALTKPVNVLLVTSGGTYKEPLLGVVTASDLANI